MRLVTYLGVHYEKASDDIMIISLGAFLFFGKPYWPKIKCEEESEDFNNFDYNCINYHLGIEEVF